MKHPSRKLRSFLDNWIRSFQRKVVRNESLPAWPSGGPNGGVLILVAAALFWIRRLMMAAFIWNANPGKVGRCAACDRWRGALRDYISEPSNYVYWSIPARQKDIQVGDLAFIWRTKFSDRQSGIVAAGVVAESPRQLTGVNLANFSRPDRIKAAGWNEATAPSPWKTGIAIRKIYWEKPLAVGLAISQGTVRGLSDDEVAEIDRAIGR